MVRADKLTGKKVISSNGNIIGEVNGVELDLVEWTTTYLYVDVSEETAKELGIKTSFWSATTIRLPITTINQVGDVITLNEKASDLKGFIEGTQKSEPAPTMVSA